MKNIKTYKKILEALQQESTCLSRQTAAILVSFEGSIIAVSYNGVPRKVPHCSETGCRRKGSLPGENLDKCPAAHAETNCIYNCAREGIKTRGATMYCSHKPCLQCAGAIIQAGIVEVIYFEDYPSEGTFDLLAQGGVTIWKPYVENKEMR